MSVPALRFRGFTEVWKKQLLGSIFSFKNGVNASKEQYGNGFKFINVLDIINNDFITYENIIGAVDISTEEFLKNEVKYGDVLFQRSSETREEVGQSNVYIGDKSVTFGGFVIRGRGISEYHPHFFNYVLKTDAVRDEVTQRSGGSTRYNIGQESLNSVELYLPTISEQKVIANFLRAIDEKITQITQKHDLLTQYKKGVMQQIFSQELRFEDDDGGYFPEWSVKTIKELTEVVVGGTPSTTNQDFWQDGSVPWISSGELNNGIIKAPIKHITHLALKKSSAKLMPKNTTVLAMTGATLGKVGFLSFETAGNQSVAGFLPNDNFHSKFLFYSLLNDKNQVLSLAGGGAQQGINKGNIEALEFGFPHYREQTKIANFLTAIDDKITATQTQLQGLKQYKQGLLQQMFV